MKARLLVVFALTFATSIPLFAQTCSTTQYTNTLVCTIPQLFGPGGLRLPNPNHVAHFADVSEGQFRPLNQAIGQALAILPLGSSGSGPTFTLDAEGHHIPTLDSLGPILTERANVIGKRAINLGVAYQYFDFSHIDGIRLDNFTTILIHDKFDSTDPTSFRNDHINTINSVHVELNQTVIYGVFGITNHMDASIEVPIQAAHLRVVSAAHIVRTQPCEVNQDTNPGSPYYLGGNCYTDANSVPPRNLDPNKEAVCAEFHYFQGYTNQQSDCATIFKIVDATFPNPGISFVMTDANNNPVTVPPRKPGSPVEDAKGIGDITLRAKYEVIRREKLFGSIGLGIRFPSGDANNFLGTGAYGLIPFGALTYTGRLSPHVRLGYEWNSSSILAGDASGVINSVTNKPNPATASLPGAFLYSGGADYRVSKWVTVAADLIGQRVFSARRLIQSSYLLLPEAKPGLINGQLPPAPTSADAKQFSSVVANPNSSYNSDSIAVGGKVRLKGQLLLIGNATFRVDDGGLRANVVPLVGLSYAF